MGAIHNAIEHLTKQRAETVQRFARITNAIDALHRVNGGVTVSANETPKPNGKVRQASQPTKRWLTTAEVAKRFGVSSEAVRWHHRNGNLPGGKLVKELPGPGGKGLVFPAATVERIAQKRAGRNN